RQAQEDDLSILPKVELSDVPNDVHWPTGKPGNLHLASGDLPYHFYDRGTNGIAYQHLILPLPAIPDSLQALLPLYSSCLTELGAGEHSYLDMQARQSRVSGGFNAHISMRSKLGDEQALQSYLILSGKSLYENHGSLSSLMQETLQHCRFDEQQRIHELVRQMSSRREQGITGQGHSLAMGLACSGLSPIARYEYENAGLAG